MEGKRWGESALSVQFYTNDADSLPNTQFRIKPPCSHHFRNGKHSFESGQLNSTKLALGWRLVLTCATHLTDNLCTAIPQICLVTESKNHWGRYLSPGISFNSNQVRSYTKSARLLGLQPSNRDFKFAANTGAPSYSYVTDVPARRSRYVIRISAFARWQFFELCYVMCHIIGFRTGGRQIFRSNNSDSLSALLSVEKS